MEMVLLTVMNGRVGLIQLVLEVLQVVQPEVVEERFTVMMAWMTTMMASLTVTILIVPMTQAVLVVVVESKTAPTVLTMMVMAMSTVMILTVPHLVTLVSLIATMVRMTTVMAMSTAMTPIALLARIVIQRSVEMVSMMILTMI